MRKLPAIAFGAFAAALAGTAIAANRNHVMTVALPDGSTARVEYVGDVQPRVTVVPTAPEVVDSWVPLPSVAGLDRMIDQMNRQADAMLREVQLNARGVSAASAAPFVASFGNAPAGVSSTTVVSYSNGRTTCTRTTQAVSQGPGKPPKVTSSETGDCRQQASPAPAPVPAPSPMRLDHT